MTQVQTAPSSLSGTLSAPPSKSHSLRAILLASFARGESIIENVFDSPDAVAMVRACQQLGATILRDGDSMRIMGVAGKPRVPEDIIDAGNSGQVLRFVAAMAAMLEEGAVVLSGDHSIRHNRPMAPLLSGLQQLGATCISTKNDGRAPVLIQGPVSAGTVGIDGQDSQPVSALLMLAAFLEGATTIEVENPGEQPWVGLTLDWLDRLQVPYTHDHYQRYTVEGGRGISAFHYRVPGDFSSLAFPIAAAIVTGSSVTLQDVDMQDSQGDKRLIEVLRQMGAKITVADTCLQVHAGATLQGMSIDVNPMIDALPILSVIACYAKGTTVLHNAAIARRKESDRLYAMTHELRKMGAKITEASDLLTIEGGALRGARVDSHADHRVAMSLVVAGLGAQSETVVQNTACINKSYRQFLPDLAALGATIEVAECL